MSAEDAEASVIAGLDEDLDTVEVDHSPTKTSSLLAVVAAVIAAITSAPFALIALPLGLGGIAAVAGGLYVTESRTWITLGAISLFLSVIAVGGFGTPVEILLISTAATILAWDLGQYAIGLGEQVGRHSRTSRNEAIHAAISVIVATIAASVGYLTYVAAGGGRPAAAVSLLVFGLLFLIWAIRS